MAPVPYLPDMTFPSSFMTTRWSLVLAASPSSPESGRALGELCVAYAQPLLVHGRRSGLDENEANDAVQGFLAQLLDRGGLAGADPGRGRFRAYLLGAFSHYLRSEARSARTLKRGGGAASGSLDVLATAAGGVDALGLRHYDDRAYRDLTPEAAFERAWANEVVRVSVEKLREEYLGRGRLKSFEALQDTLDGGTGGASYSERAEVLGCSTGTVKVAVHRLRARLGELIRLEVADTLGGDQDLGDEVDLLFRALGGEPRV